MYLYVLSQCITSEGHSIHSIRGVHTVKTNIYFQYGYSAVSVREQYYGLFILNTVLKTIQLCNYMYLSV